MTTKQKSTQTMKDLVRMRSNSTLTHELVTEFVDAQDPNSAAGSSRIRDLLSWDFLDRDLMVSILDRTDPNNEHGFYVVQDFVRSKKLTGKNLHDIKDRIDPNCALGYDTVCNFLDNNFLGIYTPTTILDKVDPATSYGWWTLQKLIKNDYIAKTDVSHFASRLDLSSPNQTHIVIELYSRDLVSKASLVRILTNSHPRTTTAPTSDLRDLLSLIASHNRMTPRIKELFAARMGIIWGGSVSPDNEMYAFANKPNNGTSSIVVFVGDARYSGADPLGDIKSDMANIPQDPQLRTHRDEVLAPWRTPAKGNGVDVIERLLPLARTPLEILPPHLQQ